MARKTPLCMSSYKYLFNATRLPTAPSDTAKVYDPESHNHVVVVRKGKFYEVPVVDHKGEWLSEKELEACVCRAPLSEKRSLTMSSDLQALPEGRRDGGLRGRRSPSRRAHGGRP